MKKLILAVGCLSMPMFSLMAVNQENVGAGLGTMLFQNQDGLISEVSAATTNDLLGTQTFAITTGTSGATMPESIVDAKKTKEFMSANMDELAKDIAMGEGENLEALASLLAVKDVEKFSSMLQENFDKLYASEDVTHLQLFDKITALM